MGMYTQWSLFAELRKDTPERVLDALRWLVDPGGETPTFDDHSLWGCERASSVLAGQGSASQVARPPELGRTWDDHPVLHALASLKNYDDEIGHFLEWITPWLRAHEWPKFIGWELHEEDDEPTLLYISSAGLEHRTPASRPAPMTDLAAW